MPSIKDPVIRANVEHNMGDEWLAWYESLLTWHAGMQVRCPTKNPDGTPIDEDGLPGCGSDQVLWSGDCYDCRECGIFFSDYAADPPHQREEES